jgi:ABC-2 type transport system ATP-binding protein
LTQAGGVASAPALVLRGLSKSFAGRVAVSSIDLVVPRGSFFGMVGPNGAGKTTTLRMATGLLRPDAGTAEVEGIDVWQAGAEASLQARRRIGVLPEDLALFDRLSGRQLLTYTGLLRGMPADVVGQRTEELLHVLGLGEAAGTLVVDYSHGMRKKVALAAALLHAPSVLFLDEPFEAIDPVSARTLRAVLGHHRAAGGTIIFSSHVMELVERLCDAVAVVHAGRLVAVGPLDEVRQGRSLEDAFVELVGAPVAQEQGLDWLGTSSV